MKCKSLSPLKKIACLLLFSTPIVVLPLQGCGGGSSGSSQPKEEDRGLEAEAYQFALKPITDVKGLPRVLLIGDSVSMGYTVPVRTALLGRANVHHPVDNCGPSKMGIWRIDKWLGDGKWDVIHFNFGLHDLKYVDEAGRYTEPSKGTLIATPEVYAANLRKIVARLQQTGAKLIFATTTPVPDGTLGRIQGDQRNYNQKALEVMKEMGVSVNDLGGYVETLQSKLPPMPPRPIRRPYKLRTGDIQMAYDVHFTKKGYLQLSTLVADDILNYLPPK